MNLRLLALLLLLTLLLYHPAAQAQGKIMFVFGSDTGIWGGMDVGNHDCTYDGALFTDPAGNAYRVMDPVFRSALRDAYGTPMKLTWWMMCGNIFRYATNTDVPFPNVMTMYLMQRYHGNSIRMFGDELSLHYHTFAWTDYDGDGKFWWNQARSFTECRDDFHVTLAQLFLEEGVFPVSFRSGWHYMDDAWQQELNLRLPYSMHNDWPHKRTTAPEPIDNLYDWSTSPSEFIPFHPSTQDYRLPGDGKGWNVRSIHIGGISSALLAGMFAKARAGVDQVACFWGHLPETDFLSNLQKVDSLIHAAATTYPEISYRYCSAVEAMQRWRAGTDTTGPVMSVTEQTTGTTVTWTVTTDEPIFQREPFVAVKNIYEQYRVLRCLKTGENQWSTSEPIERSTLAKAGFVVCDSLGNQSSKILRYLPDDVYTDDESGGFQVMRGAWRSTASAAWGTTAREADIPAGDSVTVRWTLPINESGRYNLFAQVPNNMNAARHATFSIIKNGVRSESIHFDTALPSKAWVYLATAFLNPAESPMVEGVFTADANAAQKGYADVIKCTPLVRERDIRVSPALADVGTIGLGDTARIVLTISNIGVQELHVSGWHASHLTSAAAFPLTVAPMQQVTVPFSFYAKELGPIMDTLFLSNDDPVRPLLAVQVQAVVSHPFVIVDNEDSLSYLETGDWKKSVAQAWGLTSRYVSLSGNVGARARFSTTLRTQGVYDVLQIVPVTVNSANRALYVVSVAGSPVDSVFIDQNANSGKWVTLGRYMFPASTPIDVSVIHTGASTAGDVLRADAIKWQFIPDVVAVEDGRTRELPERVELLPNFPNPFNPSTSIRFGLPSGARVTIRVYDVLGREIALLTEGFRPAGYHTVVWNAASAPSGVYYARLAVVSDMPGNASRFWSRKLLLIR